MLRPVAGAIILALAALAMAACDRASPEPLTVAEDAMVRAELQDRSFRQFEPHVDGARGEASSSASSAPSACGRSTPRAGTR